ncbi:MAG: Type II secretion system F domain protein [Microgenomates group bacterium GW2011_GWC2_45_8]|uniref:Type II secretion system F domain protein n=1 Tax=Candidatus Nomurabacteria bacterium GW2011_GWB1_40_7 TaxID=1618744 RepID=A0A0G0T6G1_9BACT|nr:MAG: Type II secretion system F domain protein [Candidatus Nomurabacteria bacterium GW2011_GWB1_40_7]KKU13906.1 MAG: Type II secretion system F domain protein [Microgenomates group bacterium GW2011_GWC2_45_8]
MAQEKTKIHKKEKSIWNLIKEISYTRTRLSIKDQTFFVKRLSFLIKAGIPIQESLTMIREQTQKKGYAFILDTVIANVSSGQNLATSLGRFKNVFGDFAINIIGFGEQSGILSENLEYVAAELKKRQTLRKKIISAAIYPIVVTIATLGIVAFLMVFLFPKILPIFDSLHYALPLSTRIVIVVSNFITHWGLVSIASIFIIIAVLIIALKKSEIICFYFHKFLFIIPIIGKIIRDYNMANFARTFGLLLKSGVAMSEALSISVKTTPNLVYKKEFKILAGVVNRGAKISTHLNKRRDLFPDLVTQIISVGEHSGNLANSLLYLSEMYEAEIDDFTKNLSNMVEPALMIIMGMLVGFIAVSIITPIYGITQHLNAR